MANTQPLFQAILADGSIFIGGTLANTRWLEIPTENAIRTLLYTLPSGDYLTLTNYDNYYQYIEVTTDVIGGNKGDVNYEYAYVIGAKIEMAIVYKINLKTGAIEVQQLKMNDPYLLSLNPMGWK